MRLKIKKKSYKYIRESIIAIKNNINCNFNQLVQLKYI